MNRNKPRTIASKVKTNTGTAAARNNKAPVEVKDSDVSISQEKNVTTELVKDSVISSKSSSGRGSYEKDNGTYSNSNTPQETDELKREIEREEQLLKLLEANYQEMVKSSKELEQVLTFINKDSNEWQIRFQNQIHINKQYETQGAVISKNLEDLRNRFKNNKRLDQVPDRKVKDTNEKKDKLKAELTDYKMRLSQEDKAYNLANDERKELLIQINEARGTLNVLNMKVIDNSQQSHGLNLRQQNSFSTHIESMTSDSKNTFVSSTKSAKSIKNGSAKTNDFSEDFKEDTGTTEIELLEFYDRRSGSSSVKVNSISPVSARNTDLKLPRINSEKVN